MIGCAQNDFCARGTFGANRAPSCAKANTVLKQTETSFHLTYITLDYHSGVLKAIAMLDVHSAQTMHLSYAETNTISK